MTTLFARIFRGLKKDPASRLRKDYAQFVEKAYQAQQNGDIRNYSLLTAKAEALKAQIEVIDAENRA